MTSEKKLLDKYLALADTLSEIIKQPREDIFEFSYFFPKSIELFTFEEEALPGLFSYLNHAIGSNYEGHATIINSQVQFIESLFETKPETLDKLYDALISAYFTIKQTDRAFFYTDKMIDLHEFSGILKKKAEAFYNKGMLFHHLKGDLGNTEVFYKKAYELTTSSADLTLRDTLVYALANFYQHYRADFTSSFSYYNQGVELADKMGDMERKAFYLGHLAMARFWQGRYTDALEFNAQSQAILPNREQNDQFLYCAVQDAEILVRMNRFEEAFQKLLSVRDLKLGNTDAITHTIYLDLLAEIARECPKLFNEHTTELTPIIGEVNTEKELLELAQSFAKSREHPESIARSGFYKAKMLWNNNQQDDAINLMKTTLTHAKKHNRGQPIFTIEQFAKENNILI